MEELIALVESWDVLKRANREFNQRDMVTFGQTMNAHAHKLIALVRGRDNAPDFWTSLAELANHAATVTDPNAKFIVEGQKFPKDRT